MFKLLIVSIFVLTSLSAKTALVTGGAGFLGSHLCDSLIKDNYSVICVDNLLTGSMDNIQHLVGNERFTFLQHDVTDPLEIESTLDEIYNFACPASPIHYQRDPIHTFMSSVLGAYNLLELAKKHHARIFQSSTSEVYGDPLEHPQKEAYWGNVNPIGIRACYDEGKRGAETLFFDYHRKYNVKIKVARIFNTYGPRMAVGDGRVVSNFIVQALQNQAITLYGTGQQTRSFCYVDDLIRAIRLFMASSEETIGPLNLGNPQEFTMLELANEIIAQIGSTSQFVFHPLPQDDPKMRLPDISQAKRKLGWTPLIPLKVGLEKTIAYFTDSIKPHQYAK